MSSQMALPVDVRPEEVARKQTLGDSIKLCCELAGFEVKQVCADLSMDKAQHSRWISNQEGVNWDKFERLMDHCGNHVPVLWQVHKLGYDLHSLRQRETETERENRLLREENAAMRRILMGQSGNAS